MGTIKFIIASLFTELDFQSCPPSGVAKNGINRGEFWAKTHEQISTEPFTTGEHSKKGSKGLVIEICPRHISGTVYSALLGRSHLLRVGCVFHFTI